LFVLFFKIELVIGGFRQMLSTYLLIFMCAVNSDGNVEKWKHLRAKRQRKIIIRLLLIAVVLQSSLVTSLSTSVMRCFVL
jgi:hypothetical protein